MVIGIVTNFKNVILFNCGQEQVVLTKAEEDNINKLIIETDAMIIDNTDTFYIYAPTKIKSLEECLTILKGGDCDE